MSERKRPPENARLPLPAPRPGAALDEKIIAYARAKAPQRQRPHSGRWMAGLATAGIVAVTVLITLPQQPGPSVVKAPERRSAQAPASPATAPALIKMSRMQMLEELPQEQPMAGAESVGTVDFDTENAAADSLADAAGAATAESLQPLSPPTIGEQLGELGTLLQKGEETRARTGYQALRAACADCELPDTLEQALLLYPHDE